MKLRFTEYHLLQILKGFDQQHLPLDLFLSHYFRCHKALGAKDRRFVSDTAFGMMRWRALLDHLSEQSSAWESRYAIYRQFQPDNFFYVNTIPPHIRVSFPLSLFTLLCDQYGTEKAIILCQISNTEAPITIRINPLKTTREALLAKWKQEYEAKPCKYSPLGIQLKKRLPFDQMAEFKEGLFEVQDEGSQLIASKVEAKPGDLVFDYCSGSGGKSLAFAHRMQGEGMLYLHDVRPFVLEQARRRFLRAEISNWQELSPKHPLKNKLKGKLDWVLLDVPCTGTGTLRRTPDRKWKFSLEFLDECVGKQREIFTEALSYLKPGGKIVYATCSCLRQENEDQVAYFLKNYSLKMVGDPFVSLPSVDGMDGFYAVTLQRF